MLLVAACAAAYLNASFSFVGRPQVRPSLDQLAMRGYAKVPLVMDLPEDMMTIKQRHLLPTAEHLEYAVVQYNGAQHIVHEGGMYETKFLRAVPGAKVRLHRVLLMKTKNEAGSFDVSIGKPFIDGAYADITILEHLKSKDQTFYFHKPKKHQQKRKIINQKLTRFRIDRIVKTDDDLELIGRAKYPLGNQAEKTEEYWAKYGQRVFQGLDIAGFEKFDDPTSRGMPALGKAQDASIAPTDAEE